MKVFKVRWRWTTLEKKTFKLKWQVFCNISGSKKCLTTYLILFTESSGNINLPTYFQILYLVYNMEFFPSLLIQAGGYHFTIRPHRWKKPYLKILPEGSASLVELSLWRPPWAAPPPGALLLWGPYPDICWWECLERAEAACWVSFDDKLLGSCCWFSSPALMELKETF